MSVRLAYWRSGLVSPRVCWVSTILLSALAALIRDLAAVTFAVGAVSQRVSDRILTAFSLMLTLLGCAQLFFGPFPRCLQEHEHADPATF